MKLNILSLTQVLIGVSLSEPHTSRLTCVKYDSLTHSQMFSLGFFVMLWCIIDLLFLILICVYRKIAIEQKLNTLVSVTKLHFLVADCNVNSLISSAILCMQNHHLNYLSDYLKVLSLEDFDALEIHVSCVYLIIFSTEFLLFLHGRLIV